MKTEALYLANPSALEADGLITETAADEYGHYIVLDRSSAYPQGGGQPGDSGTISADGQTLYFYNTRAAGDSIRHYHAGDHSFQIGQGVNVSVNAETRQRNSALHTAGHYIACLTHLLRPELIPVKGHHFPDASYVELQGVSNVSSVELDEFLKTAIRMGLNSHKRILTETARPSELPDSPFLNGPLPESKPIRLVTIEGHPPMACGGTHMERLADIPDISVSKIKWSKDILRISYKCFNYDSGK